MSTQTKEKKAVSLKQKKISDFMTGTSVIKDLRKIESSQKVLGSMFKNGYTKKTVVVKDILLERGRKECNVMNKEKAKDFKAAAYLSDLESNPPKDGEERNIFLIRYKDGEKKGNIIGGGSGSYRKASKSRGFKVKKLVDGLNLEGIKKYESFKTEKEKTSFLLKADTFKGKDGLPLFTTDSKAGIVRFEKI